MNAKIIELEDKISHIIFNDNKRTVHFEYSTQEFEIPFNTFETDKTLYTKSKKFQVIAHTYNSKNKETFLLKKEVGESYEECLQKIFDYIKNNRKIFNSYTVIWCKKKDNIRQISYFFGSSVIEVIEKFFNGKDPNEYLVYEIKMNPLS